MAKKEDHSVDSKYKLQFIVSKEVYDKFETLRKEKFSCTSKQHLLMNEMFVPWLEKQCRKLG